MATMEGVVRPPSVFSRIRGSPPSTIATAEFVVPKSIPMILDIGFLEVIRFFKRIHHGAFSHYFIVKCKNQNGKPVRLVIRADDNKSKVRSPKHRTQSLLYFGPSFLFLRFTF